MCNVPLKIFHERCIGIVCDHNLEIISFLVMNRVASLHAQNLLGPAKSGNETRKACACAKF